MSRKIINTLKKANKIWGGLVLLTLLFVSSTLTYYFLPELLSIPFGNWLATQDKFIQSQMSIDRIIVDAILDGCPPVLLIWGIMILRMPAPGQASSNSGMNFVVEFMGKLLTKPLTTIFILLGGILIGVAAIAIIKVSETAIAFFLGFYGLLISCLGWGINKSFSQFQSTRNNCVGRFFYRYKEKTSTIYFCIALTIYLWNIFAMPVELVNYLLSLQ